MKGLIFLLSVLVIVIVYQFFNLNVTEKFSSFSHEFLYNKTQKADLTSNDSNILSTGYITRKFKDNDIMYHVEVNLPNSQGGDYINESVVYEASVGEYNLGTLVRHGDGLYKVTTLKPIKTKDSNKVKIHALLMTDGKPLNKFTILEGKF